MSWRKFWMTILGTTLGISAFLYTAVLVIDPYDTVWFSPPFARAPVTTNQRFSFPALARKAKFDSAIIGTSTTRLLRPVDLNPFFGASFVNLSMNSGTAYEQLQILKVFARSHPRAKVVIFGVDVIWCEVQERYDRFTYRPFPPWMYDENRWNDLFYLFNLPALEEAGRQLAYLTGLRPLKYGLDGHTNFLPPQSEYDLKRAQQNIYGSETPGRKEPANPPYQPTAEERASWTYATHELFPKLLALLPEETLKVLMFVPYHRYSQPQPGSFHEARWRECKRRLTDIAARFANTHVLDFMIDSAITRHDENYWDTLHYSVSVARQLARLMARGVRERRGVPDLFDYLGADKRG